MKSLLPTTVSWRLDGAWPRHWPMMRGGGFSRRPMMFRTPYVADRLRAFRDVVGKARSWTAIGADSEYGVVLSGDALAYPIVEAWLADGDWRLNDYPRAFRPARDRATATVLGDALSLACAVLASLEKSSQCLGTYVDFQGAERQCLVGGEGCGLTGCHAAHGPMGGW